MAESQEQRPPRSGFFPGGYLPRLWKAAPEPPTPPSPSKKKKKGEVDKAGRRGKVNDPGDGEDAGAKKGVLLEETPGLDTIEARRTARRIAGAVLSVLFLLALFIIYRVFLHTSAPDESSADEGVVLVDVHEQRVRNETEARQLIERARDVDRHGNREQALALLNRVSAAYPDTRAAGDAREAIGRPGRNLPLFPEGPQGAEKTVSGPTSPAVTKPSPVEPAPRPAPPKAAASDPAASPGRVASNPEAALATTNPPPAQVASASVPVPGPAAPPPSRPLPAGFHAREGVDVDPSGWPREIVCGRDGSILVLVPGGTFLMGRDGGDPSEAPAHQVKVSTFYIDKHEVTNRQFEQFVKEMGPRDERNRALARDGGVSLSDDYPVVLVSARDATEYAEWVGKKLPTEAEWEFAARGTDHRIHPWGPLPPAWQKPRQPRQIDAVMSFARDLSPYGVYDMAGNAMEWTRDWYDSSYFSNFRGMISEDPTGPSSRPPSLQLTVKGGSKQWIVSAREGIKYETRLPFLGFRCVLPVEGPDSVFQSAAPTTPAPVRTAPGRSGKKVVPF